MAVLGLMLVGMGQPSSGSPKASRSRASMPLTAGWLSARRAAARVTLRSCIRVSKARSRFRSGSQSGMASPRPRGRVWDGNLGQAASPLRRQGRPARPQASAAR